MTAATVARPAPVGQATHLHTWRYVGPAPVPREGSACSAPLFLGCSGCGEVVTVDCKATHDRKCETCAEHYRNRVRLVAKVSAAGVLLLTLTAPGRRLHYHGGAPCPCTPAGGVDLARWNASAGSKWNRFWNNGVLRDEGLSWLHAAYFRATEVQGRGALHFHVLLRVPGRTVIPPDAADRLRALAIAHGFGHEVDVQDVDPVRAMHYVAKYVSKAAGERVDVPWLRLRPVPAARAKDAPPAGAVWQDDPAWSRKGFWVRLTATPDEHLDVVAEDWTAWTPVVWSTTATYRTWSASRAEGRRWHRTMRDVVQSQAHFAAVMYLLPWSDGEARLPLDVLALAAPDRPDGGPP